MKLLRNLVIVMLLFVMGCSHYCVTNPDTGDKYYTKDIKKKNSGAVMFTDEKTGKTVTIQSSEIEKISEKEFKQAVKGQ